MDLGFDGRQNPNQETISCQSSSLKKATREAYSHGISHSCKRFLWNPPAQSQLLKYIARTTNVACHLLEGPLLLVRTDSRTCRTQTQSQGMFSRFEVLPLPIHHHISLQFAYANASQTSSFGCGPASGLVSSSNREP